MIRAIVRNGLLHPVDPLPMEWVEGREIEIDGLPVSVDDYEAAWAETIISQTPVDPEDDARVFAAIADHKRRDANSRGARSR